VVSRTLVRAGGVAVPSYQALLYAGCTTGVLAGAAVAGAAGLDEERFAAGAIALLVPALAGARLLFVLQHLGAYREAPRRIWARREGGASLLGGLVFAVAVSVPLLAAWRLPFWAFWDAAAITMLVGLVFTRVGCTLHGCCAGRPTSGAVGLVLGDLRGVRRRRRPTQLLEAGWALAVLAGALAAGDPLPAGTVFAAVVAAYAAGRVALEPWRDGGPARPNVVLFAALLAVAAAALALRA
jgi:phosphatidylglycerol---prolipoprotein diacylglyceryl transferase